MNRVRLAIAVSLILVSSCKQGYTDSYISEIYIDLTQKECKHVEDKIEGLSLVEFSIDDSWKYVSIPLMTKTENSFVLCDKQSDHLLIYDLNGNKIVEKHIKGRGRGEVLGMNNVYAIDNTICIYDGGMGNLLYYDVNGQYKSKWNVQVCDDLLYGIDGNKTFVGLYSSRNDGNNYVAVYDEQGKTIGKYFTLPKYLRDNPIHFGQTPNSYMFKDTVRFYMPFDYNIFSVTQNSFVSTYKFIPENPIPGALLTDDDSANGSPELLSLVLSEGYDGMFQYLFETDRYLYFVYFSKGKYKNCLFDKVEKNLYRNEYPDEFYSKSKVPGMSTSDVWQYLVYGLTPLYADGNDLYVQFSYNGYQMLKDCADKLDDRMSSLLNNMERYITSNKLATDEVMILKVSFAD